MSPRAFVDRPVRDVDRATRLAGRASRHWGLGAPRWTRTGMNVLFRADEAILRVSEPSTDPGSAVELAKFLDAAGIRVPQPLRTDVVRDEELAVSCWELIRPSAPEIDWRSVGRTLRRLHAIEAELFPPSYPMTRPAALPWWDFETLLAETSTQLDDAARRGIQGAIERWPNWRTSEGSVVCHGDLHPGNVLMTEQGPALLDWDLLCLAPPGWDHAPLMTWHRRWGGRPGAYEELALGYGRSLRGEPTAEGFAELRLVAATLMRLKAASVDPTARRETENRLRYWRGDPDAPIWTPV